MTDDGAVDRLFTRGDARSSRDRRRVLERDLDRAGASAGRGSVGRLVQIYNGGAMGSQPNLVYLAHPVEIDGAEVERGSGTPVADPSRSIPVVVLGHAPAAGDVLCAVAVGGRWVANRGGSAQVSTSIQVIGCAGPLFGVSVTVQTRQGGAVLFSGKTSISGLVSFSIPASGLYWVTTSAPAGFPYNRYAWGSQSLLLTGGVVNLIAPPPAAGFLCCGAIGFPIQSTLHLTVCGQTYTLTATAAAGTKFAYSFTPAAILTAGVAVDAGSCDWSGYPATTTADTLWSVGLKCPTNSSSVSGAITTSALGLYNAATGKYDAFALCPSSCKADQICQTTPITLTGTIGQTISLTGTMPATCVATCTPGVAPYAMPCAAAAITVTS